MPGDEQDSEFEFQQGLIRSLRDSAAYSHAVDRVEMIETHISYVLLAGAYAYKVKKAVDLGFLDFRSLQSRLFYCNEELRLNRRTAPALYLRVVPITRGAAGARVDGEGDAIEYAVMMGRFDQAARFDRMLEDDRLNAGAIDELASCIVDFHRAIAVARVDQGFGTPQAIAQPALQNVEQISTLLERADDRAALATYGAWLDAEHDRLGAVFARRLQGGFVRECHGDLHLANVAMVDGHVVLFDCIEFNEQFRWIDVFNELSFVAMDLQSRGRPAWAWRLIDRYLEATGDFDGLHLLRYYAAYRAMVRAKVDMIRANQITHGAPGTPADPVLPEKAHAHLRLALSWCAATRPSMVITHGLSGSGKSVGAQSLLERIGAIRLRSDVERKRLFSRPLLEHGADEPEHGLYAADATRATYARLRDLARGVVDAGYTVIVDAAFLLRWQRESFRSLAADLGIPFAIVHFAAKPDDLRSRVASRRATNTDASDADLAVLEHQLSTYEPLQSGEADFVLIRNTESSPQPIPASAPWQPLLEWLSKDGIPATR